MKNGLWFFIGLFLFTIACSKDSDQDELTDYRDEWVGTYEGIKSSRGYDDDDFSTEITFVVEKVDSSANELIIFDEKFIIEEDGKFGPEFINNTHYEIEFDGDVIKMAINVSFPFGIALPCYIKATRQD